MPVQRKLRTSTTERMYRAILQALAKLEGILAAVVKSGKLYGVQGRTVRRNPDFSGSRTTRSEGLQVDRLTDSVTDRLRRMVAKYRIRLTVNSPLILERIPMKIWMRAMVGGGLIGGMITSWAAPRLIAWWFEPPVPLGFSCRTPIEYALQRLQWAQFGGVTSGAVIAVLVWLIIKPKTHHN